MLSWLKAVENKFAWSLFGILLAILAFWYSEYYQKKIQVSYDLAAELNILDLKRPVDDLSVTFKGDDLSEKNLNLKILQIRIENTGRVDIIQNLYDSQEVWGLRIIGGKIIEARLVSSNSDYIKERLSPAILSDSAVSFQKVILESGKYFVVELLVIHNKSDEISIIPSGKIAGIDRLFLARTEPDDTDSIYGFFIKTYSGSAIVQIMRTITYPIAALVLIIAVGGTIASIIELRDSFTRKRRRKNFERKMARGLSQFDGATQESLIELYERDGIDPFLELNKFKNNSDIIPALLDLAKRVSASSDKFREHDDIPIDASAGPWMSTGERKSRSMVSKSLKREPLKRIRNVGNIYRLMDLVMLLEKKGHVARPEAGKPLAFSPSLESFIEDALRVFVPA